MSSSCDSSSSLLRSVFLLGESGDVVCGLPSLPQATPQKPSEQARIRSLISSQRSTPSGRTRPRLALYPHSTPTFTLENHHSTNSLRLLWVRSTFTSSSFLHASLLLCLLPCLLPVGVYVRHSRNWVGGRTSNGLDGIHCTST